MKKIKMLLMIAVICLSVAAVAGCSASVSVDPKGSLETTMHG